MAEFYREEDSVQIDSGPRWPNGKVSHLIPRSMDLPAIRTTTTVTVIIIVFIILVIMIICNIYRFINCRKHCTVVHSLTMIRHFFERTAQTRGAGIACWYVELWTRNRKVASSNPGWSGRRIFFSRVNFVCWLFFGVRSAPRVTAVVRKGPRSFC